MKVYVCSYYDENYCVFAKEENAKQWLIDEIYDNFTSDEIEEIFEKDDLNDYTLQDLVDISMDYDYFVEEFEVEDKPEPAKVNAPTYVMMDPEPNVTSSSIRQELQQNKSERVKQTIGASEKDSRVRRL